MAGDILQLKAMVASSLEKDHLDSTKLENKNGPTERILTQIFSSQSNEETVNENGKQTEPLLNSNISVSEAIQKPSFRRQASASTFLCPDYIPGMLYIYICLKVIYLKYYNHWLYTYSGMSQAGG